MLEAIPGYLEVLEETVNGILDESIPSLREGISFIKSKLGEDVKISHQTLNKYLEKAGKEPRQYNFHSEVKAQIKARRTVRNSEKKVDKLEKKLNNARTDLKRKKTTYSKLDEPADAVTAEGKVLTEDQVPTELEVEN
jgi:uncharacterized protein (DUF3084 family)